MRTSATDRETICALATAHGIGAISVIRVSGASAAFIVKRLAAFLPEYLESHKIYYGFLTGLAGEEMLDEVLVSYFAEGRSYTGEPCFEISCHGSEAVVNEILRQLVLAGARPAQRGEFTYRAFMSGRIDLVQAESVLELIESRSNRATQLALRQLKGGVSQQLKGLLDRLIWVLAHLEANIDFASEDIELASSEILASRTEEVLISVREMIAGYRQGRIIRNGYHVALVGRPNAGKSSLLNALAGEERAIVTPVAGTTRDFVEAEVAEGGLRLTLVDTAGLRVTDDAVEKIGVMRTLDRMAAVELVIYVLEAGETSLPEAFAGRIPWEKTLLLVNKIDQKPGFLVPESLAKGPLAVLNVSATTGAGLKDLRAWLANQLRGEVSEDSTVVSNARHYQGLDELRSSLEKSLPLMRAGESPDLIALELQSGLRALHEVLGIVFDDQVMDRVFNEFCLGK